MRMLLLLGALGALASCSPDYEDVPVKLTGVGYDPDEIGPSPTPYGGVVEYDWINFAGGGLSLSMMGLAGYDEAGPGFANFKPPYAAVFGFSYLFDHKMEAADSLGQVTSVPPEVDDACYTSYEASGPIGSFKTVDVGSYMEFRTLDEERSGGFRFDRYPSDYPPDAQGAFVYYIGVGTWVPESVYGVVPGADGTRESLERTVIEPANFPFGEELEFRFPGGLQLQEVPVASVPRPSSAVGGNAKIRLPNAIGGVQMEWAGPRYDRFGDEMVAGEAEAKELVRTCLSFVDPGTSPETAEACAGADSPLATSFEGQVYTGPWDTDDGQVLFRWVPAEGEDDYVSLSVRFLGPVDREDTRFTEQVIKVPANGAIEEDWASPQYDIPEDAAIPEGRRAPTACEDEEDGAEWVFDDAYETHDGDLMPAMQGDPNHNLAEVSCRLADDGEFALTAAHLEQAMLYAQRHGAQGAIFYFSRSSDVEATVPAAKDQYNQKLEISPVKLTSRAIDIGRFWYAE